MLCFLSSHLVSDLAPTPSPLWKGTWAVDTYHGMFPMLATYFGKLDKKKKSREAPFHMDQMPDCFHGAAILIASPLHHSFPVSPFHKQMENEKNSQVQLDSTRAY